MDSNSHSRKLPLLALGFLSVCTTYPSRERGRHKGKKKKTEQPSSPKDSAYYRKILPSVFLLPSAATRLCSILPAFPIMPLRAGPAILCFLMATGPARQPRAAAGHPPLSHKALRPLPWRMGLSLAEATTSLEASEGAAQLSMAWRLQPL